MSGLYQRALSLLRIEKPPEPEGEFAFEEDSAISKEDQKEILSEIEKIAAGSRIAITPEIFTIRALKRGTFFPLMVNLFSILLLAGGLTTLYLLFQRGKSVIMEQATAITTAEGQLIQELKKESEAKLLEKNKEISNIQSRLLEIDQEREDLQSNMESKVQERENELRSALERELENERVKLRSQGISEEDINRKLRELELEKSFEYNRQLEAFKQEAEAERLKLESNLKTLQNEYEQNLTAANNERLKVLDEARQREAELQSQLEEKTRALDSEKLKAQAELRAISEQRQQENQASDRLISLYNTVARDIQSGKLNEALIDLEGIKNYLNEESIVTLPSILKRREVEFFVLDSLENLVRSELGKEEVDTASLIASANILTDIKDKVIEAENLYQSGRIGEAEELYSSALATIPEINQSHNYFTEQKQREEEARKRQLEAYLTAAESAFRRGNYTEALKSYTGGLAYLPEDQATIDRMITQVKTSGFQLGFEGLVKDNSQAAAAPLAEAQAYYEKRQYNQALLSYLDILARYPQSRQAETAVQGIKESIDAKNQAAETGFSVLKQDSEERIKSLENNLQARLTRLTTLEQEKSSLVNTVAGLKQEIDQLNKSAPTTATAAEIDEITRKRLENFAKIESSYNRYAAREDDILGRSGEEGLIQSKLYLDNFLASTEEVFPGLWQRIKKYDRAFELAGRSSAMQDAADIIYELSTRNTPGAQERFLNNEINRNRDDEIMVDLLNDLKELVK